MGDMMYLKFRFLVFTLIILLTIISGCDPHPVPSYDLEKYRLINLKNGYSIKLSNKRFRNQYCISHNLNDDHLELKVQCYRAHSKKLIQLNLKKFPKGNWKLKRIGNKKYYYQIIKKAGGGSMSDYTVRIVAKFGNHYALYSGYGLYEEGWYGGDPAESSLDWEIFLALTYKKNRSGGEAK